MSTINMTLRGTITGICPHKFDASGKLPKEKFYTDHPIIDVRKPVEFAALDIMLVNRATQSSTLCRDCPVYIEETLTVATFSPVTWTMTNTLWAGNPEYPGCGNQIQCGSMSRGNLEGSDFLPLPLETPISAGELTYLHIQQSLEKYSRSSSRAFLSWFTGPDGTPLPVTHISTGPFDAALIQTYWYVDEEDLDKNSWNATFEHRFVLPPESSLLAGEEASGSEQPGILSTTWETNQTIKSGRRLKEADFSNVIHIARTTNHDEE